MKNLKKTLDGYYAVNEKLNKFSLVVIIVLAISGSILIATSSVDTFSSVQIPQFLNVCMIISFLLCMACSVIGLIVMWVEHRIYQIEKKLINHN